MVVPFKTKKSKKKKVGMYIRLDEDLYENVQSLDKNMTVPKICLQAIEYVVAQQKITKNKGVLEKNAEQEEKFV